MKVIASTCYMHITVQRTVCVQQEESWKYLIATGGGSQQYLGGQGLFH